MLRAIQIDHGDEGFDGHFLITANNFQKHREER